jgi:hypothetical protein
VKRLGLPRAAQQCLRRAPKVCELHDAFIGDEDVAALDVAVDDAVEVKVIQPLQHLPAIPADKSFVERPELAPKLEERATGDILHTDLELLPPRIKASAKVADDVTVRLKALQERHLPLYVRSGLRAHSVAAAAKRVEFDLF